MQVSQYPTAEHYRLYLAQSLQREGRMVEAGLACAAAEAAAGGDAAVWAQLRPRVLLQRAVAAYEREACGDG